jgi:hypothetical protein
MEGNIASGDSPPFFGGLGGIFRFRETAVGESALGFRADDVAVLEVDIR